VFAAANPRGPGTLGGLRKEGGRGMRIPPDELERAKPNPFSFFLFVGEASQSPYHFSFFSS